MQAQATKLRTGDAMLSQSARADVVALKIIGGSERGEWYATCTISRYFAALPMMSSLSEAASYT